MTGLLLLSVQSIFENLSKIRRKVFHARKGALNTLNDVGKPLFLRSRDGGEKRGEALALRGPPAISQIAVLSAVIDRRYSGRARHHALYGQSRPSTLRNLDAATFCAAGCI